MEKEQKALGAFVSLHANKVPARTNNRCVFLVRYTDAGIPLDTPLVMYTLEDIVAAFDTESTLIHWVIQQIQTYDVDTQSVVGLIFDRSTILTHVIRKTK